MRHTSWLASIGLWALLCVSCDGSEQYTLEPPQPLALESATLESLLPAPSELPRSAAAQAGSLRGGFEYAEVLPANRISVAGTDLVFAPDYDAQSRDLSGLAYAFHEFDLSGFSGSPRIQYNWDAVPAQWWVGLPNRARNAWDWYPGKADGSVEVPSLGAYLSAEDALLSCPVLVFGAQPAQLQSAQVSPGATGLLPCWSHTFGAADVPERLDDLSISPSGEISANGHWGDSAVYGNIMLRYAASGALLSARRWISDNHSAAEVFASAFDAAGDFYFCSYAKPDGVIVTRVSAADEVVWSRHYMADVSGFDNQGWGGEMLLAEGNVYIAYERTLTKLAAADGAVAWQRGIRYSPGERHVVFQELAWDAGTQTLLASGNAYMSADSSDDRSDLFIGRFNPDGTLADQARFDSTGIDYAAGLALDASGSIYAGAQLHGYTAPIESYDGRHCGWLKLDADLNLELLRTFLFPSKIEGASVLLNYVQDLTLGDDGQSYLAGAYIDEREIGNGGYHFFLARIESDGNILSPSPHLTWMSEHNTDGGLALEYADGQLYFAGFARRAYGVWEPAPVPQYDAVELAFVSQAGVMQSPAPASSPDTGYFVDYPGVADFGSDLTNGQTMCIDAP